MMKKCMPFILIVIFSISGKAQVNKIIKGSDTLWNTKEVVPNSVIRAERAFRDRLMEDPYRPAYHFNIPGKAGAADPNGFFYYKGKYHLFYLYKKLGVEHSWGHVSSKDLFHWRHHKDAILPTESGEDGIFSGGAYISPNGIAYLSYWQLVLRGGTTFEERVKKIGASGIGITQSSDENFNNWEKFEANPVIESDLWGITKIQEESGDTVYVGSADPSNIWKKDGTYYMLTGNLLVLNKFGRADDSPDHQKGDRLYLWSSEDLKNWKYEHRFYESKRKWTGAGEDNMCPVFLPLPSSKDGGEASDKHLLLFISHNRGAQYYIGDYKNDRFFPQVHGRMSWQDRTFFAPEALIDGQGRLIMLAQIYDDRPDSLKNYYGWTGGYSLPRSLWLGEDGTLRMKPSEEVKTLRLNQKKEEQITVDSNDEVRLDNIGTELMELQISFKPNNAEEFGVNVRISEDGSEKTKIYYDQKDKKLKIDTRNSGADFTGNSGAPPWAPPALKADFFGRSLIEEAPLELNEGERLDLRIFVDKSIVEVFANNKQALVRRIYPKRGGTGVSIFSEGGSVETNYIKAWEIMPSNPY